MSKFLRTSSIIFFVCITVSITSDVTATDQAGDGDTDQNGNSASVSHPKLEKPWLRELNDDLLAPTSPAFAVLGINPESVIQPTNPKEFALALREGFDDDGRLESGFALDFSPLIFSKRKRLDEIEESKPSVSDRTQFSVAFADVGAPDASPMRVAIGARIVFINEFDPKNGERIKKQEEVSDKSQDAKDGCSTQSQSTTGPSAEGNPNQSGNKTHRKSVTLENLKSRLEKQDRELKARSKNLTLTADKRKNLHKLIDKESDLKNDVVALEKELALLDRALFPIYEEEEKLNTEIRELDKTILTLNVEIQKRTTILEIVRENLRKLVERIFAIASARSDNTPTQNDSTQTSGVEPDEDITQLALESKKLGIEREELLGREKTVRDEIKSYTEAVEILWISDL